ncbi:MAG: 30S ribosome-binding factor RbfA [candidate division Zixibacteria bacterium]|nr:30S ribosome-binding factor RbfA [candidate division Zixibacteria bacterium]MCK4428064.1 30S ribosome-binding factor RbfA [candidate division Zixibacteria bacterium]
MQYKRAERVGDLIKEEVSRIIQYELKDPGVGFVTITGVKLSDDLKYAKIFYSVLGNEEAKKESSSALRRACGFIQHEIGRKLRLKYTPEIYFHFDPSVEYGAHIEKLIKKIHKSQGSTKEDLPTDEDEEDEKNV